MKSEIKAKTINQVFTADSIDCSQQNNSFNKEHLETDINKVLSHISEVQTRKNTLTEEDIGLIAEKVAIVVYELKEKGEDSCDMKKIKKATNDIREIMGNIGQAVEWVFKISTKLGL